MLDAFKNAINQLGDPAIRRIVWLSLALTVGLFVLLYLCVGFVLTETTLFQESWLETIVDVLGGLATLILTWLLFPVVASTTVGFFLEQVTAAVERRHYRDLPPPRDAPVIEVVASTARFFLVTIALNLVMLLFLFFPPIFPFVFYGVNGYLLGREYFEVVASRRLATGEARSFRRARRGSVFVAGLLITALLTIPLVGFFAPIIGTAAMVHLFEQWRRRP